MFALYDSGPFEDFILFPYTLEVISTHLVISFAALFILI
jgi:hypothetical protein